MTIASDSGRFERERLDADRRYNDALTDLDRSLVAAAQQPSIESDDRARLATALLVFLQHITAFVDTKDREIAARANERIDAIEHALTPLAELRTQVAVIRRAVEVLGRPNAPAQTASPPSAASDASAISTAPAADYRYVAFEDQFRGSDEAVAAKLQAYVPLFAGAAGTVVDLGCGRGELLTAFTAAGVSARGVDANADMAAIASARGLDAVAGDALSFLRSLPDASLGGLVATQVVEHLEPSYLMQLLDTAAAKLKQGAPIALETINPACWLAFFSSYIRDITHVRPVHPDTLQYLLRAYGFERVEIRYSAPVPELVRMRTVDLPPSLAARAAAGNDDVATALASIAHAVSANSVVLNNLMFTHLDYAAIGYRT